MKLMHHAVALLTATAAVFAGVVPTHPQTQSGPAYLVVEVNVKDQEGFNDYAEKATETVSQYGGTFIAMDGSPQTIEGVAPNGNVVIIRFDSIDDAQTWLRSPEYSEVKGLRHRTADTRQFLVEGLPNQ
jgi:uncharacterized protein (DUF1330 family)